MKIGVPTEIKVREGRVGLIPEACRDLIAAGHEVYVETGAGVLSGYSDDGYQAAGAQILADAATLYGRCELIVKVKEPVEGDLRYLNDKHLLFCFLHLAAKPALAQHLCDMGLTAVAFETVTDERGLLPLLTPMSEIAGRLSVQIGTHLLHQPQGGRGVLLGGLPLTERGHVVVLGAGRAGSAAARLASDMGAAVTVFDKNRDRLADMHQSARNIQALYAYESKIRQAVAEADLLVGAVLMTGAHAPRVVSRDMVRSMRAGSVIMDIAIDQGGCVETSRPTDYSQPTFVEHDVIHFGVTNMPGAVPRTASQALSAVITPYVRLLADDDWRRHEGLLNGVNVRAGKLVHPAVAEALGAPV